MLLSFLWLSIVSVWQLLAAAMGLTPEQAAQMGAQLTQALAQGGPGAFGGAPPGAQRIQLTEEEAANLNRLVEMGFDRTEALQVGVRGGRPTLDLRKCRRGRESLDTGTCDFGWCWCRCSWHVIRMWRWRPASCSTTWLVGVRALVGVGVTQVKDQALEVMMIRCTNSLPALPLAYQ